MAIDLRRRWVMYPENHLNILSQGNSFYKEKERVGKGFGIQEKSR